MFNPARLPVAAYDRAWREYSHWMPPSLRFTSMTKEDLEEMVRPETCRTNLPAVMCTCGRVFLEGFDVPGEERAA